MLKIADHIRNPHTEPPRRRAATKSDDFYDIDSFDETTASSSQPKYHRHQHSGAQPAPLKATEPPPPPPTGMMQFGKTQRGRDMLVYAGYRYVQNRQSTRNKFWRCSRYVKYGCRATVVTSKLESTIRMAGAAHSHGPDETRDDLQFIKLSDSFVCTMRTTTATPDDDERRVSSASQLSPSSSSLVLVDLQHPADALQKSLFNESGDDEFEAMP